MINKSGFDPSAYTIVVTKGTEGDKESYFAYVQELPDISSYADGYQDVYENCIESLEVLHADAIDKGKDFPMPYRPPAPAGHSGRVTLRMSRSMHADIARCADEDGVSLNQWIIEAIAQRRGYYVGASSSVGSRFSLATSSSAASTILSWMLGSHGEFSGITTIRELKLSSSENRHEEVSTAAA